MSCLSQAFDIGCRNDASQVVGDCSMVASSDDDTCVTRCRIACNRPLAAQILQSIRPGFIVAPSAPRCIILTRSPSSSPTAAYPSHTGSDFMNQCFRFSSVINSRMSPPLCPSLQVFFPRCHHSRHCQRRQMHHTCKWNPRSASIMGDYLAQPTFVTPSHLRVESNTKHTGE